MHIIVSDILHLNTAKQYPERSVYTLIYYINSFQESKTFIHADAGKHCTFKKYSSDKERP